jgi:hypothetical protein
MLNSTKKLHRPDPFYIFFIFLKGNLLKSATDFFLGQLHAVLLGTELKLLGEGNFLQTGSKIKKK